MNHKQTFDQEINGGYIWSPKTSKDGSINESYNNLTRTKPNDIIFSYANARIQGIGVIEKEHIESGKPEEFGPTGENWDSTGWMVQVSWIMLDEPIKPKSFFNQIEPLLPPKYSPLTSYGGGNQRQYLSEISQDLADLIISKSKERGKTDFFVTKIRNKINEEKEIKKIDDLNIHQTEKEQIIKARVGQGQYRFNLCKVEKRCRFTGVDDLRFLIASHIKPWRISDNYERIDGNNGLLLSPHADKLFDGGFIAIDDKSRILTINNQIRKLMKQWGIDPNKKLGIFNDQQSHYLKYHRYNIFEPLQEKYYG